MEEAKVVRSYWHPAQRGRNTDAVDRCSRLHPRSRSLRPAAGD
jgi:hypothetical protein